MDIASISSAYTAIKTIKEIGNTLLNAKIDSEAKHRVSEFVEKLGSVQDALFYIREELIKVQDENQNLKAKIKNLEDKLQIKEKLTYEKSYYWLDDKGLRSGPFCQRCYDVSGNLVHLQGGKNDVWQCYECKAPFYGPNYQPPQPRPRSNPYV
jgi:BMFP domain-containing protein YqiC